MELPTLLQIVGPGCGDRGGLSGLALFIGAGHAEFDPPATGLGLRHLMTLH
jgi:hypothetical protein